MSTLAVERATLVRDLSRDLERAAYLICLDRAVARRCVMRALAGGSDEDAVRRTAYSQAIRGVAARPPSHAPLVMPWDGELATDDDSVGVRDALIRAVEELPARDRALLAATVLESLSVGATGQILGMSSAATDAQLATVLERLTAAHTAARAQRGQSAAEFAVAGDLQMVLAEIVRSPGVLPLTAVDIERAATSQGRRRAAAIAGSLVLALGAAGAIGSAGWRAWQSSHANTPGPSLSGSASPSPTPSPVASELWNAILAWPQRGTLAADPALVASLRLLHGPNMRVIWADRVPGIGRVVLVMPSARSDTALSYQAPATGPFRWTAIGEHQSSEDHLLLLAGAGTPTAIVLAPPAVRRAELAYRVTVRADGTARPQWAGIPLADGIGMLPVTGPVGFLTQLRLDAAVVDPNGGMALGGPETVGSPGRSTVPTRWQDLAVNDLQMVAAATGEPPETMRQDLIYDLAAPQSLAAETIYGGGTAPATSKPRLVTIATTLASGAVIRSSRLIDTDGSTPGSVAAVVDIEWLRILPKGHRTDPVVAGFPQWSINSIAVVSTTASSAMVVDPKGKRVKLTKGVAILPWFNNPATTVRTYAADGSIEGTWRMSTQNDSLQNVFSRDEGLSQ